MKNPFEAWRDRPVLAVLARLLDDETITHASPLYKSVKICLEEVKDKEIKGMLHNDIVDDSRTGLFIQTENGGRSYVGFVNMVDALESSNKELAEKAAQLFRLDCKTIRDYIRCKYHFSEPNLSYPSIVNTICSSTGAHLFGGGRLSFLYKKPAPSFLGEGARLLIISGYRHGVFAKDLFL